LGNGPITSKSIAISGILFFSFVLWLCLSFAPFRNRFLVGWVPLVGVVLEMYVDCMDVIDTIDGLSKRSGHFENDHGWQLCSSKLLHVRRQTLSELKQAIEIIGDPSSVGLPEVVLSWGAKQFRASLQQMQRRNAEAKSVPWVAATDGWRSFVHLSICPFVHLSICPFVFLSIYPFCLGGQMRKCWNILVPG